MQSEFLKDGVWNIMAFFLAYSSKILHKSLPKNGKMTHGLHTWLRLRVGYPEYMLDNKVMEQRVLEEKKSKPVD